MTQSIHVAAAVILDAAGQILIARRPADKHQGGLWEFPGGKVEAGETAPQALARELHEELGIQVRRARPLIRIRHDYSDKSVLLDVWRVVVFDGQARGCEGQPIRWVPPAQLNEYEFPAANRPIISAAQLPERLLITGSLAPFAAAEGAEALAERISQALEEGPRLLMLRDPEADPSLLNRLYRELAPRVSAAGSRLTLNTSIEQANAIGADALHLNSARLMALDSRQAFQGRLLSASCHNEAELAQAARLGLDFVTLSPVAATASHPGAPTLGWLRFHALADRCPLPIYALGGLSPADLKAAWGAGAQGIATLSDWWQDAATEGSV